MEFVELVFWFVFEMLHRLEPVKGDAGMFGHDFWVAQWAALSAMAPEGCKPHEDGYPMQVITVWFNILGDILGFSNPLFPYECQPVGY